MTDREYTPDDRGALVSILRENVPRYFAASDVANFEDYLSKRQWTANRVYVDGSVKVVGCAGYYLSGEATVGLAWMFFAPGSVGARNIRRKLKEHLSRVAENLRLGERLTFKLNTVPRMARFLTHFGFEARDFVRNGFAPGYDLVSMEMRWPNNGFQRTRQSPRH
jgi:ribosomal-protein-alanine N-acetyltransferase